MRDPRDRGVALGFVRLGVLMVGGYLGGRLSTSKGAAPDQTVLDSGPTDQTPATETSALTEGEPQRVVVEDTPVFLLRRGAEIFALHDRCSHRGCSLSEGTEGDRITCSCHGSRFDIRDGSVKASPATAAQPAFELREGAGRLEIRQRYAA